jgi:hypothetical protein
VRAHAHLYSLQKFLIFFSEPVDDDVVVVVVVVLLLLLLKDFIAFISSLVYYSSVAFPVCIPSCSPDVAYMRVDYTSSSSP